jgi:hypothetical protein
MAVEIVGETTGFSRLGFRLSLRYGKEVFMTCHFCAQNASLFSCFNKIIPQIAKSVIEYLY